MRKLVTIILSSFLSLSAQAKESAEVRGGQQTILLSEEFNKPKKFANYTVIGCGIYKSVEKGVIVYDMLNTIHIEFEEPVLVPVQVKDKGKSKIKEVKESPPNYLKDGFKNHPELASLLKVIEKRKIICNPSFANHIIKWSVNY